MPAYRFCRTDDIPFLVDALNACYVVHFPGGRKLSAEDFKREIRELGVWCSSCMVASADGEPIAVATGAKRERETLIHRIGVHPGFLRRGHARHLLESLGRKLSVLGPPRVVTEVPDDLPAVRHLFEAVGYRADQRFADLALPQPLAPSRATGEVGQASLDDLLRAEALDPTLARSWERDLVTLQSRKKQLQGLAIASDARVEACVLFRDLPWHGRREIVAFGGAAPRGEGGADGRVLLEIVVRLPGRRPRRDGSPGLGGGDPLGGPRVDGLPQGPDVHSLCAARGLRRALTALRGSE
jgi:GNAT superfamily N-acetyltransferase